MKNTKKIKVSYLVPGCCQKETNGKGRKDL